MLIKFTYVDKESRRPVSEEPAVNGPEFPSVPGITFDFGNESEWPCSFPLFYGSCDDDADPLIPGIIDVLSQDDYDAARSVEMNARIERHKAEARQRRGYLLFQSDWTQLPDAPVDRAAWAAYRQALRDFPSTWTPGPTVTFPTPPSTTLEP